MSPPGRIVRPNPQPDQAQMAELYAAFAAQNIPLPEAIARLNSRNMPVQTKAVPFFKTILAKTDAPQLLIPTNKGRMCFMIGFIDSGLGAFALVLFSYGAPPAPNLGFPLLSPTCFMEANGTTTINDIWIQPYNVVANAITYPATVFAVECSLAVESIVNRQTAGIT